MNKRRHIFSAPRVSVRLLLPAELLAEIDAAAELAYVSRSGLVAEVLRAWVKRPGKRIGRTPDAFDLLNIAAETRRKVEFKRMILDGWRAVRSEAKRGHRSVSMATTNYLRRVNSQHGVTLSRATLFNWDERYRAKGLAGLCDQRARSQPWNVTTKRNQTGVESHSKTTRRSGGKTA